LLKRPWRSNSGSFASLAASARPRRGGHRWGGTKLPEASPCSWQVHGFYSGRFVVDRIRYEALGAINCGENLIDRLVKIATSIELADCSCERTR
jgi:hypothetical protein